MTIDDDGIDHGMQLALHHLRLVTAAYGSRIAAEVAVGLCMGVCSFIYIQEGPEAVAKMMAGVAEDSKSIKAIPCSSFN